MHMSFLSSNDSLDTGDAARSRFVDIHFLAISIILPAACARKGVLALRKSTSKHNWRQELVVKAYVYALACIPSSVLTSCMTCSERCAS